MSVSRIVVGVDGSAGSDAALRWAVAEAELRRSRLRVVHAYHAQPAPLMEVGLGAPAGIAAPATLAEGGEQVRQRPRSTLARSSTARCAERATPSAGSRSNGLRWRGRPRRR